MRPRQPCNEESHAVDGICGNTYRIRSKAIIRAVFFGTIGKALGTKNKKHRTLEHSQRTLAKKDV